ncbi:SoxS protein [Paracoccus pacificus]|uniref:SoxS protein n=1 Tax=Paracoccus pacificus TaxID=1463598 RepID=A0ABW4R7K8_9RHOB
MPRPIPFVTVFAAAFAVLLAVWPHPLAARDRATPPATQNAETDLQLLMVDRRGCVYCLRWEAEIGPDYPRSAQGRIAPLRRVDLDGPWPDGIVLASRPWITPTFILLRNNMEVSRIEGYVGKKRFWPLLDQMLVESGAALPRARRGG